MERQGILPGHLEGFQKISQDEHRHVAYGTWYLQQKARDPALAQRIQDRLMATLPAAAGVLVPPGYELGDEYEYLGYTSQEMNEFAFTALSAAAEGHRRRAARRGRLTFGAWPTAALGYQADTPRDTRRSRPRRSPSGSRR